VGDEISRAAGVGALAGVRDDGRALRVVQVVFAVACAASAVALIFQFGPVSNVENATSVRILGAALAALAVGAFSAAEEPWRHRSLLQVEIVFTALTSLFLAYRLLAHHVAAGDRAVYLLPPVAICCILLLVLYPWRPARAPSTGNEGPVS
jgi:hypothetical protein